MPICILLHMQHTLQPLQCFPFSLQDDPVLHLWPWRSEQSGLRLNGSSWVIVCHEWQLARTNKLHPLHSCGRPLKSSHMIFFWTGLLYFYRVLPCCFRLAQIAIKASDQLGGQISICFWCTLVLKPMLQLFFPWISPPFELLNFFKHGSSTN